MKTLKKEYWDLFDEWVDKFSDTCCGCHLTPPCGFCVHAGNPTMLIETSEAWEENGEGVAESEVQYYASLF